MKQSNQFDELEMARAGLPAISSAENIFVPTRFDSDLETRRRNKFKGHFNR